MSDIGNLLKSVAPKATRPSPEAVDADLARGRAARISAHRRRTFRRATLGATSLVVAAAAVVATGAVDGSHASRAIGNRSPSAVQAAGSPVPHARDTAFVVQRVRAKIADDLSRDNTARQSFGYLSGELSSGGSLINPGPKRYETYGYTGPDGTEYFHDTVYNANGSPTLIASSVVGPVVNGKESISGTTIDPTNRTYSRGQLDQVVPGGGIASAGLNPGLSSSPSQLQQALQSGQVTQMGTPAFNGRQAIALSLTTPRTPGYQNVLYVDPQTYEPLGQAYVPDPANTGPNTGVDVTYWVPATANNIAMAKEAPSIPAGYTKAAHAAG